MYKYNGQVEFLHLRDQVAVKSVLRKATVCDSSAIRGVQRIQDRREFLRVHVHFGNVYHANAFITCVVSVISFIFFCLWISSARYESHHQQLGHYQQFALSKSVVHEQGDQSK